MRCSTLPAEDSTPAHGRARVSNLCCRRGGQVPGEHQGVPEDVHVAIMLTRALQDLGQGFAKFELVFHVRQQLAKAGSHPAAQRGKMQCAGASPTSKPSQYDSAFRTDIARETMAGLSK